MTVDGRVPVEAAVEDGVLLPRRLHVRLALVRRAVLVRPLLHRKELRDSEAKFAQPTARSGWGLVTL